MIEVGSSSRGSGGLANGPTRYVFAARVTSGFADPFSLLVFGAKPGDRHERQTVHEKNSGEPGIDGRDFLGDDLEIHVAYATAPVLLWQKAHRET